RQMHPAALDELRTQRTREIHQIFESTHGISGTLRCEQRLDGNKVPGFLACREGLYIAGKSGLDCDGQIRGLLQQPIRCLEKRPVLASNAWKERAIEFDEIVVAHGDRLSMRDVYDCLADKTLQNLDLAKPACIVDARAGKLVAQHGVVA